MGSDKYADASLDFRVLARGDFPRLVAWLNTPHVYEWWGRHMGAGALGGAGAAATNLTEVEAKYGPGVDGAGKTQRYLIMADGEPVGLIQWYRLDDFAEYARQIGEISTGAAGIDFFLGEPAWLGRGFGTRAVERFTTQIVLRQPGISRVIGGPAVTNARSIRVFEKAGFRRGREVAVPGEPVAEAIMVRRAKISLV